MQDPEGYQQNTIVLPSSMRTNSMDLFSYRFRLVGGYYVDDLEKNKKVNELYEERIRPQFEQNVALWRGMGGEPEARYIEFSHEYRDITKQCSLLY